MKRKIGAVLLAALLAVTAGGCRTDETENNQQLREETLTETTEQTLPAPTVPADGEPGTVTAKGTYTGIENPDTVVARVAEAELTNRQLWVWYWTAAAQYRQTHPDSGPDFSRPLDSQPCEADPTVNSWQQYFLRQALNAWHSAQAMAQQAAVTEIPTEEAYQPNADTHERCMTGKPATKFLYGYDKTYEINTMHSAYLDNLPDTLDALARDLDLEDRSRLAKEAFGTDSGSLEEFARLYNYSYSYLTYLSYDMEPTIQEAEEWFALREAEYAAQGITRDSGSCVDIRYVLLTPEEGEDLTACEEEAEKLLYQWKKKNKKNEYTFSEIAVKNSEDPGSAASGGSYLQLTPGQLPRELEDWCFAAERQSGDRTVITTEEGVHMLYFCGSSGQWQVRAREDLMAHREAEIIAKARESYPMEVDYSAVTLSEGQPILAWDQVLYPDIAHERYPEVPLYLQQDYPKTWYGNFKISSHGCGITTFSMLTTYMADEEWTPPEMCAQYGNYSFYNGTDGMIFINEPSRFGYYLREKTYDYHKARAALEEGQIVISIQHKGYWTSGGHYILFEKFTEDGMVQVRDSNIANYLKLRQHKEDKHTWANATNAGSGYWIFEDKVTRVAACDRCGTQEGQTSGLVRTEYICEKCNEALIRRNTWLGNTSDYVQ